MESDSSREAWRRWWDEEGRGMRPLYGEDAEQFARQMTEIAWENGAFWRRPDIDRLRAELVATKDELATKADELAAMQKQRDEARGQTWYLLYGGTSADGRGQGKYIGRTTDKEVARKHHAECRKNPFSIGFVEIVTDTEKKQVSYYGGELQPEKEGGGA